MTVDGRSSAVIHLDSDQPLRDDDGRLITDEPWGVYFKPDRASVQGGAAPLRLGPTFDVDPYPTGTVDPGFPDMWCAALSHCLERFAGSAPLYRQLRSGGAGAFTADNFPVFDHMRPNVYVAADSNHGYKMIAVGPRDRARAARRALVAAAPVPLRALRDRRPAPGLAQPVPLELISARGVGHGRAVQRRCPSRSEPGCAASNERITRTSRAPGANRSRA